MNDDTRTEMQTLVLRLADIDLREIDRLWPRSQPILGLANNLEKPGDVTHQAHSRSTTPVGTRRARRNVLIRSSSGERGTSF